MNLDGSYSNEFEAAFDLSRRETTIQNDSAKIHQARLDGKFVVVSEHEVCCKFTDGLLGYAVVIDGIFDTEAEAKVLSDKLGHSDGAGGGIAPPIEEVAEVEVEEVPKDECPF